MKLIEQLNFYQISKDYFLLKRNFKKYMPFSKSYFIIRDSIEKQNTERLNLLTASLMNVESEGFKSELEVQRLQSEKKDFELKSIWILFSAGIITGTSIIVLLIMFIRKRKQEHDTAGKLADEKIKLKELEARDALHELELKKKDITNLVLHNTQMYESNKKVIERLAEISKSNAVELNQSVSSLMTEMKNQSYVGENAISIQSNIDTVNAEFYDKLRHRFQGLTKAEEELCGYIRINLSTKDIAVFKNIESDSVKVSKKRLRKKLGINPEDDLYELIQSIA